MLVGREPEQARIDRALDDARQGSSATLVLRGDSGIGKTALLNYATAQAEGMRVLRARGVEFEADVPFAGLHELLRPALPLLHRIPTLAAQSLASVLGLGSAGQSDRLLVGAATLELLVAWAESPLLVVVDDAHWLDRASAETLAFAARRLLADPVALLAAVREGEPSPFLEAGLEEMRLGGLDSASSDELFRHSATGPVDPEVAGRILEVTAGNPLALVEMASEAQRYSSSSALQPLPVPLATTVERAYLRRSNRLSDGARTVLLLAAASGGPSAELLTLAAEALAVPSAAFAEAEGASELVRVRDRSIEFVHPLAAAAIYHSASSAERREAHRALAAAMEPASDRAERRAWHLAAAAAGPDEAAADALEVTGERARGLAAYAAAEAAFEEAARLSVDPRRRCRRTLAAADSAWLAAQADRALSLLNQVRSSADGREFHAEVEALAGRIALEQGEVAEGFRLIRSAASGLVQTDRLRAIHLLASASLTGAGAGLLGEMLATGAEALALLRPDDPPAAEIGAHTAYGCAAVLTAQGDEGPRHLRIAAGLFAGVELGGDPLLIQCAASVGLFLREAETGRDLLERAHAEARAHAPAAALPFVLFYLARDLATTDGWAAARADYEEGARLARDTGQHGWLTGLLAGLAQLDALEGRGEELLAHAAEVEVLAQRYRLDLFRGWVVWARALHEVGAGRSWDALAYLTQLGTMHERLGIGDPDIDPAPDLAEVSLRLGDRESATQAAARFHQAAAAKGQPFALARAERAKGMVAADSEFDSHYRIALEQHARTRDSFEAARTRLSYGERLRRARRRREARLQLSSALDIFTRLGASPWVQRTLVEMGATGEHATRGTPAVHHRLTPQEMQIALALAEGLTTREAAAKLYLSPKTVEYHLRNVYDKLEIRSREELRAIMGTPNLAPPSR